MTRQEAIAKGFTEEIAPKTVAEAQAKGFVRADQPTEPPSKLQQAADWLSENVVPDFSAHGKAGAAVRGFGQGEAYNFVDELRGLGGAQENLYGGIGVPGHETDTVRHPDEGLIDFMKRGYVSERDAARKEDATASDEHPGAFYGGQVVGAVASPSPASKAALPRLGIAGLQGLANGLGNAEHLDTEGAETAGLGGLLGLGGGALGEGMRVGAGFFKKGVDTARQAINAKNEKAIADAIASQKGKLGGAVQVGSRDLEVLGREAPHVGMPLAGQVNRFMAGPDAEQLVNQVVSNKLEGAPSHLQSIDAERAALQRLIAEAPQALSKANADAEKSPITSVLAPRVARYVGRAVMPAAGAAVGGAIGDQFDAPKTGMAVGGIVGGAIGGNPGTAIGNALRDPRLALGAGKAGMAASNAMSKLPAAESRTAETYLEKMRKQKEEQPRQHFLDGTGG